MAMTTVSLRRETTQMLRTLGAKGQTYDEIVRGLIERASVKELDAAGTGSSRKRSSSRWTSRDARREVWAVRT